MRRSRMLFGMFPQRFLETQTKRKSFCKNPTKVDGVLSYASNAETRIYFLKFGQPAIARFMKWYRET
jgi:hypothetical protein